MSIDTAVYYYPEGECLVDFLPSEVEKLSAWLTIEPATLDLTSQSGAYDLLYQPKGKKLLTLYLHVYDLSQIQEQEFLC